MRSSRLLTRRLSRIQGQKFREWQCQRQFSSSDASSATSSASETASPCWLDLRGSGLSVLERLLLEECLLHHDDRSWMIVGHHEATQNRYLSTPTWTSRKAMKADETNENPLATIVMGIGGKPQELLNVELVKRDEVLTLKRFSGGGTVVLDFDSIWTTLIGRRQRSFDIEQVFPRAIMQWTADAIFEPLFDNLSQEQLSRQEATGDGAQQTLVLDTKSCGPENTGRTVSIAEKTRQSTVSAGTIPKFSLQENDYVLGERKMGGNAQSIVKSGWLHHTSFLWAFQQGHMDYLTLPSKRPEYRKDRQHDEFLVTLQRSYPKLKKRDFYEQLRRVCEENFDLQPQTAKLAMDIVNRQGGLQHYFEKGGRTRIVHHDSF